VKVVVGTVLVAVTAIVVLYELFMEYVSLVSDDAFGY